MSLFVGLSRNANTRGIITLFFVTLQPLQKFKEYYTSISINA